MPSKTSWIPRVFAAIVVLFLLGVGWKRKRRLPGILLGLLVAAGESWRDDHERARWQNLKALKAEGSFDRVAP